MFTTESSDCTNSSFYQNLVSDLTKAFDKVWREGPLLKILESGVSGRNWSETGWPFEQKCENARRSPTKRSHLTDTLSLVHQQHHDCAFPTCLQHPTCRWSRCMECIWIHIFCLQNPASCEQGTAEDKWLGSSNQWSEDSGQFSPSPPPKKKSP